MIWRVSTVAPHAVCGREPGRQQSHVLVCVRSYEVRYANSHSVRYQVLPRKQRQASTRAARACLVAIVCAGTRHHHIPSRPSRSDITTGALEHEAPAAKGQQGPLRLEIILDDLQQGSTACDRVKQKYHQSYAFLKTLLVCSRHAVLAVEHYNNLTPDSKAKA